MSIHGGDDEPVPFGQWESGRFAVHARTERAGYRVGACDRLVDRLGVGDLADDHADRAVPRCRYLCFVADVGGDGVTLGQQGVNQVLADLAGRTEDCDVH